MELKRRSDQSYVKTSVFSPDDLVLLQP
jgi:hypothetical protein